MTKCQVANEIFQKRHVNVAQNTINFLHQTSNETLRTLAVRDRFAISISTKKIMEKHNLMNEVKAKAEKMGSELQKFNEDFKILFEKGLPPFWNKKGKLLKKEEYVSSLKKARQDHSKFQNMDGNLNGEVIIDKIGDNFSILDQFQIIKDALPPISFSSCVELEVLEREMVNFEFPLQK